MGGRKDPLVENAQNFQVVGGHGKKSVSLGQEPQESGSKKLQGRGDANKKGKNRAPYPIRKRLNLKRFLNQEIRSGSSLLDKLEPLGGKNRKPLSWIDKLKPVRPRQRGKIHTEEISTNGDVIGRNF